MEVSRERDTIGGVTLLLILLLLGPTVGGAEPEAEGQLSQEY